MNVILIDIGGLRADALQCYGGDRPNAPTIDCIATHGVVCQNAYTSDATIAGGRAAVLSGMCGLETHVVTDGHQKDVIFDETPVSVHGADAPRPLLQDYLGAHGMYTVAVSPFGRQPARWFYHGWHEVHDPWSAIHPHDVPAHEVRARVERRIECFAQQSLSPFFLYVTFNDLYRHAHMPISEREKQFWEELSVHGNPDFPEEDMFTLHCNLHAAFSPRVQKAPTREAVWKMRHSYNARLRLIDEEISAIYNVLETHDLIEETALIITSNHGALFGENGCYGGHTCAHTSAVKVPLIIKANSVYEPGTTLKGLSYTLDIAPTICELTGCEPPDGYHGMPLKELLQNDAVGGRDYVVCSHGEYTAQRSIITDKWKLNRTWHGGFWDFKDTELYDLTNDPREEHDVAGENADAIRELQNRLRSWVSEYQPNAPDPLARIACDEPPGFLSYGEQLRAHVRRGKLKPPEEYNGRWA